MRYWRGYLFAVILGALALALSLFAKQYSMLVDAFYPFLTREIQTTLAAWSSTVDVTVWQVVVLLLVLGLLLTVVLMVALKWNFFQWLGWVLAGASLIWLLHTGVYGLNYYASPLSQDVHLDSYDFTVEDMADATIYFRDKVNELAAQLPRDDNGDLKFSHFELLAEMAGDGFHTLTYEQSGSVFAGSLLPVKKLAWADLYTAMGITMPLTGEAAVNPQIPVVALPFTICHEMAHRMCIATENDANFAAFLACIANDSVQFQYSAYYMAYRYCYSALLNVGSGEAAAAAARIDLEVNSYLRYDLKIYDRFFSSNRSELATNIADAANDAYLKVSGDTAGIESYGQVATDLVNWYMDVLVMPYIDQREESGFDPLDKDYVNGILGNG